MSLLSNNNFYSSDYESGNSSPLSSMELPPKCTLSQRPKSYAGMTTKRLEDIMQEFKCNGLDTPYDPDEDVLLRNRYSSQLSGMGPASGYLRQKSWPEPERSPAAPLPARAGLQPDCWGSGDTGAFNSPSPSIAGQSNGITPDQLRVLQTLPNVVLYSLLRDLQQGREKRLKKKRLPDECRFCKNNGEREGFYRSHVLKDDAGRVTCPVLRAFVCKRCGASGYQAHTIKYCPLSTDQERIQSSAMMRSVRMASGRKRTTSGTTPSLGYSTNDFINEETPSFSDNYNYVDPVWAPLDPVWAALEKKLML